MKVPTLTPVGKVLLAIGVLVVLSGIIANIWVKKAVVHFLKTKLPSEVNVTYDALSVNSFRGLISFDNLEVIFSKKERSSVQTKIMVGKGGIHVNLLQMALQKTIHIQHLRLDQAAIVHYTAASKTANPKAKKSNLSFNTPLQIDKFSMNDATLSVANARGDSTLLTVEALQLDILDLHTNAEQLKQNIPFTYGTYNLSFKNLSARANRFEQLTLANFHAQPKQWSYTNFAIVPNYKALELSQHINVERDHISLSIPAMKWTNPSFKQATKTIAFKLDTMVVSTPTLRVFRDKLVADDHRIKPLYSEMLKTLPFDLAIDVITIQQGEIYYTERIAKEKPMEGIRFTSLNATIRHLGNSYRDTTKTWVHTSSKLMNEAPLVLNWNFNANDESNHFNASGSLNDLNTSAINPYLKANLNTTSDGRIDQLYFSIYGNHISTQGQLKMKYKNLSFKIMKSDLKGVNKILTAIGSLFVKDHSKDGVDDFRYATIETTRDQTKSFFNYVWLNVSDGLLGALTGNGKLDK